ncbi:Exodeoxyribonuclease VII large subunit [Rubritalea squalenifaciens DSM 18772]|uniref:Exodeoxyribonuclease 7 large subunit n=1 Tax=Rubritalea squalenifaciens DSM 18772 TaxID=1123071 RepID=A0A1M6IU82_9BACT|nr:exodeoxyribonuclease VII large subunit [Rubritalea squalenifaciens]SHJ37997.1 Exodeoxyribonuclease VII large subunit [Rubritalea squalenifaciens DSM 18772]
MADEKTLTVTRLVRKMRNLLEIELGEVWVEGEVSNLRRQASGHIYFTLKDENAQMSCVMFRGNAVKSKVQPENGMQVKLFGEVSVYEARGSVQLIVRSVENAGEGELQAKFEALKRKLDAEGLFDQDKKKSLPPFPMRVGLITSGTGAALQDMLHVLERRAPWVQPVLYPVQVQGKGAEMGIAKAIDEWSEWEENGLPQVDVLIVGRGGGSLEDLWNFNEEVVARAIAACSLPIVSAVGHEIDFTIADFLADMRAPTPSAAAEIVVPDGDELRDRLSNLSTLMNRRVESEIRHFDTTIASMRRGALSRSVDRLLLEPMQRVAQLGRDLELAVEDQVSEQELRVREVRLRHANVHPERVIERREEYLQSKKSALENVLQSTLQRMSDKLQRKADLLRTLGPESAFARGFSVTTDKDGKIIKSISKMKEGDVIVTRLGDGTKESVIKE